MVVWMRIPNFNNCRNDLLLTRLTVKMFEIIRQIYVNLTKHVFENKMLYIFC